MSPGGVFAVLAILIALFGIAIYQGQNDFEERVRQCEARTCPEGQKAVYMHVRSEHNECLCVAVPR